ncbi:hypothetical protein SteCoe_32464 [Stentor coeruleus]|uniref:Uncharacterized protein n=1 Tax=Stentor coeruleus TaxID=5963 RepID=A0A1R2AYY9_9CILI|nr:hypothetical protein SteCoe_32464 [Stentor coeruleus]
MKALVLDAETLPIVSLVISQTEILQRDVFLVETIDKSIIERGAERLGHLSGVYFIRPSNENLMLLQRGLEYPKYGSISIYFTNAVPEQMLKDLAGASISIYFTNAVPEQMLKDLAGADRLDLIKNVVEVFADIYPINHDLFSLNLPSVIGLTKPRQRWTRIDDGCFDRMVDGVFASLLALRKFPVIRYQRSSEVCTLLAERLHAKLRVDPDLMTTYASRQGFGHKTTIDNVDQSSVILIVDRREDPVTPLLHQWTYQAMLHELLGIDHNKVRLKQISTADKEVPLSCIQDEFYQQFMFASFGDLAEGIHEYVSEYEKKHQQNSNMESIEDMKKFIEVYPEFSKMAGNVSKHVTLTSELDNRIKARMLLDVSELEQDIACNENKTEHFRKIMELLQNPRYNTMDKLKLVLLFALRYENDDKIGQLKDLLQNCGIKEEQVNLVDTISTYAGSRVRSCDLFHNKNMISRARYHITTVMKNVPNVFTQHQSYISTLIDQALKQRLKDSEFPATSAFNPKEIIANLVVFVIGGATYEEGKEIGVFNRKGSDATVLLGSNYIHSSVSFLAEISQLIMNRINL